MRDFSKSIKVKNEDPRKWEDRLDYLEEQIRKLSKYQDRYSREKLKGYKEEYDAITRKLQQMR